MADEDDPPLPPATPADAGAREGEAAPELSAPAAAPDDDWSLASEQEAQTPAEHPATEPNSAALPDASADEPAQIAGDAAEISAPMDLENADADWRPALDEPAPGDLSLPMQAEPSTQTSAIEATLSPAAADAPVQEISFAEEPPELSTPAYLEAGASPHRSESQTNTPAVNEAAAAAFVRAEAPAGEIDASYAAVEIARAIHDAPQSTDAAPEPETAFSAAPQDDAAAEAAAIEAPALGQIAEANQAAFTPQDVWSVVEPTEAGDAPIVGEAVADAELTSEAPAEPAATTAPVFQQEPDLATGSHIAFSDSAAASQHNDEAPKADASPSASAPPPQSPDALPSNFFRAAGDPDEPEAVAPSVWQRLRARASTSLRRVRGYTEPRLVALGGDARALGFKAWRSARNIRHPRTVREAAIWGGWATAAVALAVIGFFVFVTWGMPSTDDLWEARNGQSITFYDRRGNVILREGAQNAPPVDLETLPPYVAQAFIAIEDKRFYDHWGVDIGGMVRAGAQNLRAGRVVQGGSTITQQLAKNLFLTNERSWRRKAQEIAMAIWLERRFNKEEILALYLSRVYFGAGAYGIEAAAERYFDRPARELTLLQSALIAGLVKAPSRLNPARQDIDAARARGDLVLAEMVSMGFISDAERHAALQEEIAISRRNPAGVLAYYRDWIDPILNEVIGTQLDDFIVETTIDIQAQRAGAEAVETVLAEQGQSRRVGQAALVSLDDEGGVIAMVGGRDYDQSQFNRATQARRQPGSAFKYFIYLAAMENGLTPWTVREDGPITIRQQGQPDWTPGNYEEEYHGPSELVRAFQFSYNMVAIRVAHEVGRRKVIDVAERLGVTSQLHDYPSLALGAQEVTLLEMTQAYGAMASQGYRIEPHGIVRIRRANSDETMWGWRRRGARQRVIEDQPLRYMNYLMTRVVEAGTGTRARISGRQIGGKTGTGNDYRDAWFIGFTPGIVTGVWAGNDNFAETARVTGGSLPADIWARFMPAALRNVPIRELTLPGPEDFDLGAPDPESPALAVIGAPLGNGAAPNPSDTQDRSLDLGPEG